MSDETTMGERAAMAFSRWQNDFARFEVARAREAGRKEAAEEIARACELQRSLVQANHTPRLEVWAQAAALARSYGGSPLRAEEEEKSRGPQEPR